MWRKIRHSLNGWEYRSQGRTLATVWRLSDLDIYQMSRDRRYGAFIQGKRLPLAFEDRREAMRYAQENMMGWICSQFRIAGYVFAEVKQHKRSRRWYYVTNQGRSEESFDTIAEAFRKAEEAVLDMLSERTWGFTVPAVTLDYISEKPRRRS